MMTKSGRRNGLVVTAAGGGITIVVLDWESHQKKMLTGSALSVNSLSEPPASGQTYNASLSFSIIIIIFYQQHATIVI